MESLFLPPSYPSYDDNEGVDDDGVWEFFNDRWNATMNNVDTVDKTIITSTNVWETMRRGLSRSKDQARTYIELLEEVMKSYLDEIIERFVGLIDFIFLIIRVQHF